MRMLAIALALFWSAMARGGDDDPSPAVAAYLESAVKHRGAAVDDMKETLKRYRTLMSSNQKIVGDTPGKVRVRKKKQREQIKQLEAQIKEAESGEAFLTPVVGAGRVYVGYAGHIGGKIPAVATVLQITGERSAIVEIGKRDFWLDGLATGNLADEGKLVLDGVVYCSGNKTYTTVLGASKTVLLLESFDERDVLPHLPEKQREALRNRIDADVAASLKGE